MGTAAKISGVEPSAINKVDGVAISSVAKVNYQTISLFSNDSAFDFDGSNDYFTFGNSSELMTTEFSLSIWVKSSNWTTWDVIVARDILWNGSNSPHNQGWKLMVKDLGGAEGQSIQLRHSNASSGPSFSVSGNLSTDTWYHIATTYDPDASGGTGKIYLDGTLKDTETSMALVFTDLSGTNFLVGARNQDTSGGAGKDTFLGVIDEVAYYNVALTSGQVSTISSEPKDLASISPSPTHWWRMGDDSGDVFAGGTWTAVDQVGSLDGTGTNMASDDKVTGAS